MAGISYICSMYAGILCILLALVTGTPDEKPVEMPLRVGSFNIQNLGESKFSKENPMAIIKKILLRYDVIFLQEIVTQKENLIYNLLQEINRMAQDGSVYNISISERLGRGYAKEQYAFLYRTEKLRVLGAHVFPDTTDVFMRPPYLVWFSSPTVRELGSFVAIGIHTQPKNAVNETSALAEVYDYAREYYNIQDAIIMGDMNAGCSNIRVSDWKDIELWNREEFIWLISHDYDTTTYLNSCPYDRFVVAGEKMKNAVIPSSVQIFDFRKAYNLTESQTQEISDHWPIELLLKGKLSKLAEKYLRTEACFTISDKRKALVPSSLLSLKTTIGFTIMSIEGKVLTAVKHTSDLPRLLEALTKFQAKYSDIVTYEALEAARYKSTNGALDDGSSFVPKKNPAYRITIDCKLDARDCTILLCRETSVN